MVSKITTSLLQEMVQAASTRLNKQAEYVNSLNVFPVPDGDTGTNMGMTVTNGAKEVADKPANTVGEVGQILSKGLLMGARGNSGVITSQLFRGFGQSIKGKEELDGKDLAQAFQAGVEGAYKAVMKPVEGTILTVSRGAATAALKKAEETDDAVEVMRATAASLERGWCRGFGWSRSGLHLRRFPLSSDRRVHHFGRLPGNTSCHERDDQC